MNQFFYARASFALNDQITKQQVQEVSGTSVVLGKRSQKLEIDGSILAEAHNAPNFSAKIVLVRLFSQKYIVNSACNPPAQNEV